MIRHLYPDDLRDSASPLHVRHQGQRWRVEPGPYVPDHPLYAYESVQVEVNPRDPTVLWIRREGSAQIYGLARKPVR